MGSISGTYMSKALGTSDGGFAPVTASGSETTYYADLCRVLADNCVYVGGTASIGGKAGVFFLYTSSTTSSASNIGCRICYL